MKRLNRIILIALALAAALAATALAEEAWGQDPLCFEGSIAAAYDETPMPDGRLKIYIQYVDERPARERQYFICDIQVRDASALSTAFFNPNNMKKTGLLEDIAGNNGAVLAVNGDFCGDHDSGIIIRNGELYRAKFTQKLDMLIIDGNGNFSLHNGSRKQDDVEALARQLIEAGVAQTLEFGPALVKDGQALPFNTKPDNKNTYVVTTRADQYESRTAIGQIGPNHYVILVCDGSREYKLDGTRKARKNDWDGYSLQDVQQLMLACGAQTAINLDGGGSTKLYFRGQVINHPSSPSRQVSDALIIK